MTNESLALHKLKLNNQLLQKRTISELTENELAGIEGGTSSYPTFPGPLADFFNAVISYIATR